MNKQTILTVVIAFVVVVIVAFLAVQVFQAIMSSVPPPDANTTVKVVGSVQ